MPSNDLGASVRGLGALQPAQPMARPPLLFQLISRSPGHRQSCPAWLPPRLPETTHTGVSAPVSLSLQISAQPTDPPPRAVSLPLWDCFLAQLPREGLWTSGRDSGG